MARSWTQCGDGIIRLRYVEIDGQLRKALIVVKMRAGEYSKDIDEYDITGERFRVGARRTGYHGLITASPPRFRSPGLRSGLR